MKRQRILIVDDSELTLTIAREALEKEGYDVVTASNGVEANAYIFSRDKLDLIIFDVMLPMLDGDKKAKLLKEKEAYRDIPMLLISTKSSEELKKLADETGADGFIHKPFTGGGIVASARQALAA